MGKPWAKLWTEMLGDRKVRRIDPAWRWCWCGLIMLAAETDDDGALLVAAGEPMTDGDIADALAVPAEMWAKARAYFVKVGMMRVDGETLVLVNYPKRQASPDPTAAKRMSDWRERKGSARRPHVTPDVTPDVTPSVTRNVTRNEPDELRVTLPQMLRVEDRRQNIELVELNKTEVSQTKSSPAATQRANDKSSDAFNGDTRYDDSDGHNGNGLERPDVSAAIEAIRKEIAARGARHNGHAPQSQSPPSPKREVIPNPNPFGGAFIDAPPEEVQP